MKENVQKGTVSNEENKKHGSGKRRKNGRCSIPGDGRIAGQRMQKDSAAAQLFKTSNENFAELFNHVLPSDAPLRAEELQDEDIKETAYLHVRDGGGTFLVQYRDVVKSAQNGRRFVILGIENQSDIDYAMPFRVLEMDFINYARQVQVIRDRHNAEWKSREGRVHVPDGVNSGEYLGRFLKTDRMERCVTLVVYWGKEPWDGPMRLSELFRGENVPYHTVQLEMNLLDVCRMSDEEICRYTGELRTVFGFRKYADDTRGLRRFILANRSHFSNVSETALDALVELTHSPELENIRTQKRKKPEGGINVCEGIKGMIEEGIREGELKAKREMALTLFADGSSMEKIAGLTKVSVSRVREWVSEKQG